MYELNPCSPLWDQTPVSGFNVKVVRILFLTVLFLLYIMYLVINLILRKSVQNLKNQDSGQRLYEKEILLQNWERQYMLMFGDHVVAVGFVICFSPYQLEILLSLLYFTLRCVYEILSQKYNIIIKPIKTILRIINLSLYVCASVGLSRTAYQEDKKMCRDIDYRLP